MICKLCHKETNKLCNSHIIPEFFYKPLYDEPHRFHVLTSDFNENNYYEQKGIREFLLCRECETKLSRYEKYVKLDFYDVIKNNFSIEGDILHVKNLNYKILKLFQLSIIWRASISSHKMYNNATLGPHQEKIRLMLLNENAGRFFDYGCITNILLRNNLYCDDLILSVEKRKWDRHNFYFFVFGGFFWIYIASSHSDQYKFKNLFLQEDGTLILIKKDLKDIDYLMQFYEDLYIQGKLNID